MEGVGLSLGGIIAYYAYSAYSRGGGKTFLLTALGFILITMSSIVEGILYELTKATVFQVHALRATLLVAGLLLIIYSVKNTK